MDHLEKNYRIDDFKVGDIVKKVESEENKFYRIKEIIERQKSFFRQQTPYYILIEEGFSVYYLHEVLQREIRHLTPIEIAQWRMLDV